MNTHYLKIALRNLARQKVLATINILGLSLGIGCFTLFLLYAVNEFSYDRFHKNAGNIYRVYEWYNVEGRPPQGEAPGYVPLGPALKQDFPDVENFARIGSNWDEKFARVNDKMHRVHYYFADPELLTMFSFKLLSGNATTALKNPYQIVLTRDKAMELFGDINVVGKTVDIKMQDKFESFIVSAVAENIPSNSSIQFGLLGSFAYTATTADGKAAATNWHMSIGLTTYVQLKPGSKLAHDRTPLIAFRKKYYAGDEEGAIKEGFWNGKGEFPISFRLQPLRDMHTNAKIEGANFVDPKNIWILIAIASGLLLIACINFTTLAIGRSASRAKEVGVRKVIGSQRKQLIWQFLTESLLLSIFSAGLGLLLSYALLPLFNRLAGTELHFSFSRFPEMIWLLVALVLLVGIMAGSYPALVLSGFKPIEVLKNKFRLAGSNIFTRSLVTFQFVLSIGLVISTVIILRQLSFMRDKNLGFDKENIVVVDAEGADTKKIYPLFREAAQKHPEIKSVSASEMGMGEGTGHMGTGYELNGKTIGIIVYPVDQDFLKVLNIQLVAGRNFNPHITSDTVNSILVNESMIKTYGLTAGKAVGTQLTETRGGSVSIPKTIIGVVKDFNFDPLSQQVRPQIFTMPPDLAVHKFYIRLKAGDPSKSLAAVQGIWKSIAPELPFQYSFMDDNFDRFYKGEERWSNIVGWAGGISIFLACLGLFGLISMAVVNRTKEIGIRKVLGASLIHVMGLLSKDFIKLITIAWIIAIPLAWYFMNDWLQSYAYRIEIGWLVFAITGMLVILIAAITISIQTAKAGLSNPVKSLRTE